MFILRVHTQVDSYNENIIMRQTYELYAIELKQPLLLGEQRLITGREVVVLSMDIKVIVE